MVKIGDVIDGRYKLLELLGNGAMGEVYKAEHCLMRKLVAIKILHPEMCTNPEIVERFRREAQAAAIIEHPNVCRVMDFSCMSNGAFYLVMEYIKGESLSHYIKRLKVIPAKACILITKQILEALGCAHDNGIVHRDVKPENIQLIGSPGEECFLKLLDFGISRNTHDVQRLTQAGYVYGTPQYLSPEQALGSLDVDHRCDLYSVGIMMFEMLTGKVPFEAPNYMDLLNLHRLQPAPHLRDVDPGLAWMDQLDAIIQKLLAKDRNDRYQSAYEVIDALDHVKISRAAMASQRTTEYRFMQMEDSELESMPTVVGSVSGDNLPSIVNTELTPEERLASQPTLVDADIGNKAVATVTGKDELRKKKIRRMIMIAVAALLVLIALIIVKVVGFAGR